MKRYRRIGKIFLYLKKIGKNNLYYMLKEDYRNVIEYITLRLT